MSMAGFACGSDRSSGGAETKPRLRPTNIVSNADIRRTKPATPERTILTWAQAIQFGDLTAVEAAYSARVRRTVPPERLRRAAKVISSLLGHPEIVNVSRQGDSARVRVALVSYDAEGKRVLEPTTFPLRLEDGRWLIDDSALLLNTAAAIRRAAG